MKNVSKVVVDDTVIEGHQKPYIVYKSDTRHRRRCGTAPRVRLGPELSQPDSWRARALARAAIPAVTCRIGTASQALKRPA